MSVVLPRSAPEDDRPGHAGAASWWRRLATATWWDLRTVLGNGEQLLVTLVIPVALLVAITRSGIPDLDPLPQGPGALAAATAVAVVSSAFTGQSIALAFDRRSGLLRFLVGTPLGRHGVVTGRLASVVLLVVLQTGTLVAVAAVVDAPPSLGSVAALALAAGCGAAAFAALGMLLGGTVRAEAVLALANLLWLVMLAVGGLVVPVVGGPAGQLVAVTPPGLLGEATRAAVGGGVDIAAYLGLLGWALGGGVLAARLLRWS